MENTTGSVLTERASMGPLDIVKEMKDGGVIVGVTWTFTAFSIIIVAMRFAVRKKLAGKLQLDDWLMLAAVVRPWILSRFTLNLDGNQDSALTPS